MFLRSYLWKKAKILKGLVNTKFRSFGKPYDASSWWDSAFYVSGVSDRQTISSDKNALSSLYHYRSVEQIILKHLINSHFITEGTNVSDIGSGAGHWIDFWKSLGAAHVDGLDVSQSSIDFLTRKFSKDDSVTIHLGRAVDVMRSTDKQFSVVNAIGVMFHIIDDREWLDTITAVSDSLRPNGIFVVGEHFGFFDGINVQIDRQGEINKRLRSYRHWQRSLKEAGFSRCTMYRNRAYLNIRDTLPENNILIALK